MSQNDWLDLGKSIGHSLKNAIDTLDFTELNSSIEKTVNSTTTMINKKIRQYSTAAKKASINLKYDIKKIKKLEKKIQSQLFVYRVLGVVGGVATAVFGGFDIIYALMVGWGLAKYAVAGSLFVLIPALILLIVGIGGMNSTKKQEQYMRRFHVYISNLHQNDMIDIPTLSQAVYSTERKTIEDLNEMIADQLFLQGHIDQKKNLFYATNEAYEASKLPDIPKETNESGEQEDQPLSAQAQETLQIGEKAIMKIRRYNDLIKDPIVSQKLTDLENNIRHILTFVQEHPEEVDATKNMTKYYLPSIDKLLETYVELNNYPNPGDNIKKSKHDIENTLDTLNYALSELYDDLFEMTTMEVASDISVLETLLAREGLTKEKIPR